MKSAFEASASKFQLFRGTAVLKLYTSSSNRRLSVIYVGPLTREAIYLFRQQVSVAKFLNCNGILALSFNRFSFNHLLDISSIVTDICSRFRSRVA